MDEFRELSHELRVLNAFIEQRMDYANKESAGPRYGQLELPIYKREILAVQRINKLIELIYKPTPTPEAVMLARSEFETRIYQGQQHVFGLLVVGRINQAGERQAEMDADISAALKAHPNGPYILAMAG